MFRTWCIFAAAAETPAEAAKADEGEINILFSMENPEIVLVEDAMDPDTHALILEVRYCS